MKLRSRGTHVAGPAGVDETSRGADRRSPGKLPWDAVLFDMDGTLVDSSYDWAAIRELLGVDGGPIIDHLDGLDEPERSQRWRLLEEIEAEGTREAGLKTGVAELLALLDAKRIATALVTNNNEANTNLLLGRFDLHFDVVITRDSGLWKPSGAPLAEAMRRLAVDPVNTMAVGDSHYDVRSAREAGCGAVCILSNGANDLEVDLRFADVPALVAYLRTVT